MRTIDETDLDILALLLEDARRPYNDIAERVDVSAPTVSDRIDRLRELGVIQGFTVDLDRTTFTDGIEVLLDVSLCAAPRSSVVDALSNVDGVEHVFLTSDARLVAVATLPGDQVGSVLTEAVGVEQIESYRVHLLDERAWVPSIQAADGSLTCEVCDEPVNDDGVSLRVDGELHHFCDRACRRHFEDRRATVAKTG